MLLRNLFGSTSPLAISIGFDADPPAGGGDVAPAPTPAPAPTVLTDDGGNGEGENSNENKAEGIEGEENKGGSEGEEQTDEQKAAAEETRRAELTDEARAEEDRRAALTDEERAAEDKAKELAEAGAPETYDFAEVLGEDGPQLDPALLEQFTGILKGHNLTQEQANQYMGFAKTLQESWLGQITQAHVDARAAWREAAENDPKLGGDKFEENVAIAKAALGAFGTPELKALLDETGIGDHPEVIRYFHNVGVVNREHEFVKAGKPASTKSFYDHPTSQPRG